MATYRAAGIDGCRSGWVVAATRDGDDCVLWLSPSLAAAWEELRGAACILVDIPIGLPGRGMPARACDRAARRILGAGATSRVFPPPARETLAASGYPEACARNRRATGAGISKQTWNIVPKIREADAFLASRPEALGILRESHPELVFATLGGGGRGLRESKKTPSGHARRMGILARFWPAGARAVAAAVRTLPRSHAAADDLLDAAILGAAALKPGTLTRLPPPPEPAGPDACGLPCEMVIPAGTRLR